MGRLEREFAKSCDEVRRNEAFGDPRTVTAAAALCIARTNVELTDEAIDTMVGDLADVAEMYKLSPDDIQHVLSRHEPTLGEEVSI